MRQIMTTLATGHYGIPVVQFRIIGMEFFVTKNAIHLMFAAFVLEPFELIVVTAAAFFGRKRFEIHFVEV